MTSAAPTTRPMTDGLPAGTAAVAPMIAGAVLTVGQLGQLATLDRSDLVATLADPAFRTFSAVYAAGFVALVVALVALHLRQANRAGRFGFAAFCAAVLGTMVLGANMWFEAFASPWLIDVAPQLLTTPKAAIWQVGYLSSYILFAVGWVAFGVSCLRAKVLPTAISVTVVVGGAIGFMAAQPPFALPLALALVAAGVWVRRVDRAAAQG